MTFQETKHIYHTMPVNYRLHGNMPTQTEMFDDVEHYLISEENSNVLSVLEID